MRRSAVLAAVVGLLATRGAPLPAMVDAAPAGDGPSSIADLKDLEDHVVAAAAKALPAMVFIDGGSGVLISPDGYIVTNNHVIAEAVSAQRRRAREGDPPQPVKITVNLLGGRRLRSEIVGRDPRGDVALLKIEEPGPYPFLELGDSDGVRQGQWVMAMGNPFLLGESFAFFSGPSDFSPSISLGVVSALHRSDEPGPGAPESSEGREQVVYSDSIQIDAAVNPGSSGGPLFTLDGKVVGINGKIQTSPARPFIQVNAGVGYAVPSNQILRFLEPLKKAEGGVVRRGNILGIRLKDEDEGLRVTFVAANSPAAREGFRSGDRLVAVDRYKVPTQHRFDSLLATYPAGSRVKVKVARDGAEQELQASLDPEAPAWLGVTGETATERKGVVLREVIKGSPAEKSGLQAGDVITAVDGTPIAELVSLIEAIGDKRAGDMVRVRRLRDGKEEDREVRLEGRPNG